MKEDWHKIFITHYNRYPLMEVEDYIKLIYQSVFGPHHFHENPSIETVRSWLEKELSSVKSSYDLIEDIGNDYVRVYLGVINDNLLTKDKVVEAFISSMNDYINIESQSINFISAINSLKLFFLEFYEEAKAKELISKVEDYMEKGIRPIHHSQTYRDNYYPHYRVIARKYL